MNGETEGVILEDVQDAVRDMVELIKLYKSKNRISKVLTSTLFKHHQEKAQAAIDTAMARLQVRPMLCSSHFHISSSPLGRIIITNKHRRTSVGMLKVILRTSSVPHVILSLIRSTVATSSARHSVTPEDENTGAINATW